MAKVLNKRTDEIPTDAIYVGRPSKWGNPYQVGRHGTREEVVEKYRLLAIGGQHFDELRELRGKDLVCWCAPKACHADVLLKLANEA